MSKKRGAINAVIGIDETNQAFQIESKNLNHYNESFLIIAGYLSRKVNHANYGNSKYERKRRIFNGHPNMDEVLTRAGYYLKEHPDFFYAAIPKKYTKKFPVAMLKANASALLVFKFFLQYDLNPSNTAIILDGVNKYPYQIHEMDKIGESKFINEILDVWLKRACLKTNHTSKTHADDKVIAVRKADRVGYYLAALNFLTNNPRWAFQYKRVSLNQLEDICAKVADKYS